jgi:hypothetical protein
MKKFFLFSLFCVVQGFLFLWMRKMPSFAQAKVLFVSIEAAFCGISGLMYLYGRPQAQKIRSFLPMRTSTPQVIPMASSEIQVQLEAEKKELLAKLESVNENVATLQSKLQLQDEKSRTCQEKLAESEKKALQCGVNKKVYSQALLELSAEIQKLCSQIEQDRKTHSVEIRALLGKDDKRVGVSGSVSSSAATGVIQPAIAPIAAVLLILLQCQKGFEKSGTSPWPDAEHRDLIRRAFFDRLQQAPHIPLAVFSLEMPAELYVSPKFPQALSSKNCTQIVETFGPQLRQLSPLEPFQVDAEGLLGTYVAFKVAWHNLDDLVVMVPMNCS